MTVSQVRDVLQDLLKQKAQMLTEGIVASRKWSQVLQLKIPIGTRLLVWFMVSLLVNTVISDH